jgi:hypothetical protein
VIRLIQVHPLHQARFYGLCTFAFSRTTASFSTAAAKTCAKTGGSDTNEGCDGQNILSDKALAEYWLRAQAAQKQSDSERLEREAFEKETEGLTSWQKDQARTLRASDYTWEKIVKVVKGGRSNSWEERMVCSAVIFWSDGWFFFIGGSMER